MFKGLTSSLAVAAVLVTGTTAHAQSAETTRDLKCLAAFGVVGSQGGKATAAATLAILYFMGRINGREPNLAIDQKIGAVAKTMTPADLNAEGERCARLVASKAQQMGAIGKAINSAGIRPGA